MSGESPARDPDLFDSIQVAGWFSPGVVTLSGHDREQLLDVQEAKGQKGASTPWQGTKVASFTATFHLIYDAAQGIDEFGAWDLFADHLRSSIPPASGAKPIAFDIEHPDLARNQIKAVTIKKIGGMQHDGKGGATIAVEFQEYFPPKPAATGSAKGSATSSELDNKITAAQKEIAALKKEAFGP